MTKELLLAGFIIISGITGFAQGRKDKIVFKNYNQGFYGDILKGIYEFEAPKQEPRKILKMDFSGVDAPKSVEEFKTSWCNSPISQGNTGTCWCFSTSSFYESEVFRLTGQQVKLSELYTVYWEYVEKAREYVRTRGNSEFGEGSETNAVKRMMKKYGAMPLEAYSGKKEGQKYHNHEQMYNEMFSYLKGVKASNSWNEEEVTSTIKSILNHYIGAPPAQVTVKGKAISPQEYLKNVLKINPDDYIDFMSLIEQPYWKQALYDVPDNWWRSTDYYNIPLNEFMQVIKTAVKNNYSIAIGGDVSETGIDPTLGLAMIPSYDIPSEYIDENARQLRFSNKTTTDDHAMHLVGYTEKPNGTWFLIKDSGSGGFSNASKGYYFMHEDYIKLKMMTFTIHKDAAKDLMGKFAQK